MPLLQGPRAVEVQDLGGGPEACRRLLHIATAALPSLEEACGFPLPTTGPVRILVYPDRASTGGYAGINTGRHVRVCHDIPDRGLIHELAHYWFSRSFVDDGFGPERWLIEGLAEYAAVEVLRRSPSLGDAAAAHLENDELWTSTRSAEAEGLLARDVPGWPLDPGPEAVARARDWYARAYGFFHLLSHEVGGDTLRTLHGQLGRRRQAVSTAEYLGALAAQRPDLGPSLAGWFGPGGFHGAFRPGLLADSDGDGLSDAEERARGTARHGRDTDGDGELDGLEALLFDTDPCDPRSRPHRRPYTVDGRLGDWAKESPTARYRYDGHGDLENGAGPGCDVRAAWVDADEHYLYGAFRLAAEPRPDLRYQFGVDADQDGHFDVVLGVDGDGRVVVGRPWGRSITWDRALLAPAATSGRQVEFAVPRAALGLSGPVQLWAHSVHRPLDQGDWVFGDQVRGWIPMDLP